MIKEIHEGIYDDHSRSRTIAARILRAWQTMERTVITSSRNSYPTRNMTTSLTSDKKSYIMYIPLAVHQMGNGHIMAVYSR